MSFTFSLKHSLILYALIDSTENIIVRRNGRLHLDCNFFSIFCLKIDVQSITGEKDILRLSTIRFCIIDSDRFGVEINVLF